MPPRPASPWVPAHLAPDLPPGVAAPAWLEGARVEVRRDAAGALSARRDPAGAAGDAPACREAGGVVWIAPAGTDAAPPGLAGWEPLRSLRVEAGPRALAEAAGVPASDPLDLPARDGAPPLRLLLQDQPGGTLVLALAAPGGARARLAASRALEALRRAAEGPSGPGAA